MKITFVTFSHSLNGGNRVISILATELVARGHDVRIVKQPRRPPSLRKRAHALLRHGHLLRRRKDGPFFDALQDRVFTLDAPRAVSDQDVPDADIVIATWWETAPWVASLSKAKGAKVYFMQDYGAPGQELEKLIPTWRMPFTFVTLNAQLRDLIRQHNSDAHIDIMQNAVDHALFRSAPRSRGKPVRVGVMHRAKVSKGMDVAARALDQLRTRIPDMTACAVGASKDGLPDWVTLVASPDDQALAEVYRSCDLWLFPSRMEGFGLPIIEAMASHTPVVSTRVGGAESVIEDGVSGGLVDVDDWQAMAQKAEDFLCGPEETWRAMSQAAYDRVAGYSWSDAVDVFEAALVAARKTLS